MKTLRRIRMSARIIASQLSRELARFSRRWRATIRAPLDAAESVAESSRGVAAPARQEADRTRRWSRLNR